MNTRPLLVLDLDETLWFGEILGTQVQYCGFKLRPYLKEFLETVSLSYDLGVWTAATEDWMLEGFKWIKADTGFDLQARAKFTWDRRKCTQIHDPNYGAYSYSPYNTSRCKRARKFRTLPYEKHRILALDDTWQNYRCGYGHLVLIEEWIGDPQDTELLKLCSFLPSIANEPSLTAYEKRGWSNKF